MRDLFTDLLAKLRLFSLVEDLVQRRGLVPFEPDVLLIAFLRLLEEHLVVLMAQVLEIVVVFVVLQSSELSFVIAFL